MKQRKPYEIREFICPPITAAELTEDNPVWQTVRNTARRLLEKYGEAKGVSPDRFDAEQDVMTVEAHYLCVRIHAAIINGANLTLANHCDALGYEYVPYYKYPDIECVVALAYMAFKMSDRYTFYEHLFTDWLTPPDAACGIALSALATSACPPVSFDKLKLEPHPTPSDKLPSSSNFWYIALNKGLSSEEENRKAILALHGAGHIFLRSLFGLRQRLVIQPFIKSIFKVMVDHHLIRRLHALGVTVDVLHGEPFRFIWQGSIEFTHFGDLFPHVPSPQVLFRPSASAQEIFAVGFQAA